jgi:molybdate transport repressor ModE-like protein
MAGPLDVHVRPVWRLGKGEEHEIDYTLLALLEAIEESGKLTVAARASGISHRHAWNLIEKWAAFFGVPLVAVERGRGTQLSELGAKLLWAGRRAKARLEPELENLAAELADSLHDKEAAGVPVLRVHASHEFTLARLRRIAARTHKLVLDLRYRGSAEALASLRRGNCDIAGFHVTEGALGRHAAGRYAESLGPDAHRLIRVATRMQGLIVAQQNPKAIRGIQDLARPGLRFINRQRDSGTRILLDQLLAAAQIRPESVDGYETEEHTHAAVAAHVASGLADAGLGIEAAAAQFELDFLPIAREHYFFAAHRDLLEKPEFKFLLGLLRGDAFHDAVTEYHGERAHRTGEVTLLRETPPWDELL